ncbi:hypothetical protein GBN32_00335 [Plesiomonas shigelloides]|uniref:hypothetical protein n=1 Tax=Plesiomonas shigelloides TaxID=703 RepID=UPI001262438C|nr:hypothetical protein [Plesiomonas shigelloides]KAB7715720.1 hypothetical protein GBN32_00335 [Plesiomonas shigelloides]
MHRQKRELNTRMPLLINEADFNLKLQVMGKNIDHTKEFLAKGTAPFVLPGYVVPIGYQFVKARTSDQYRLITYLPDGSPITVYVVEVEFHEQITHPRRSCTQIMVWRTTDSRHDKAVRGLPQHFFSYLLDEHDIVVSDEEQTGAGRRFWHVMLDWAFSQGYHIYIADGTYDENFLLYQVKNMDEFFEKWDPFAWGKDKEVHLHRRAVISKSMLNSSIPDAEHIGNA